MNQPDVVSECAFELSQVCARQGIDLAIVRALADEGVIEMHMDPNGREWLSESCVERIGVYQRLRKTLEVNHQGAEFAVLLLAELKELRERLKVYETQDSAGRVTWNR